MIIINVRLHYLKSLFRRKCLHNFFSSRLRDDIFYSD